MRQTGFVPPTEELSRYLACVDIFISLRPEGPTTRNTSLVTALAHGLPVLAARGPSHTPEAFWDNSGLEIVDAQVDELATQAIVLLRQGRQRKDRAQQAERFYQKAFCVVANRFRHRTGNTAMPSA